MQPSAPPALLSGFHIESYQLPGRFGDLWTATRTADARRVTVKLLKPELFKDGEAIRRFQREVAVLRDFEHPYLPRVLGGGSTANGDPYLVLEYLEGRLLADEIAKGPMRADRVRSVVAQIARVLAAGAQHGLIHRGLCPEAILLVPDGVAETVKVLDFGLVYRTDSLGTQPLTELGQRVGDPTYMAPEYIEDFSFDARTDLYALGVMMYEMLTGDPPFQGRAMAVLDAHVDEVPRPPSSHVGALPRFIEQVAAALLEKDPADRPASGVEVARGLVTGQWPPPAG